MPITTKLMERFHLAHPIFQAPLAGGGDTPELVSAVSKAGGMGFIGAAYLSPEQILETGKAVRARTAQPFGINLFAPLPPPEVEKPLAPVLERLAAFFTELGVAPPTEVTTRQLPFREQLEACLQTEAAAFSFTFGLLPPQAVADIRRRGLFLLGTATTVSEAKILVDSGVDAVVAQGSEAGGHRGTFAAEFSAGLIGTMALVPQIADAISVPVIASGGIMDGRGVAAALALGASGVQLGTAFLTCTESGIPEVYREAILRAREDQTRITRAFSGRPARGISNRFLEEFASAEAAECILPFPAQNSLTRPLRSAAAKQGRAEFLSLWAGQALRLARRQPAAELISRIAAETESAVASLCNRRQTIV